MIDRDFCNSSFLALRYIEKPDIAFSEKYPYRHPVMPSDSNRLFVKTAQDINDALKHQLEEKCSNYKKIGIFLSGGMDSSILASYLPGKNAYTFRFLGGSFQQEELHRAERFAKENDLKLHYVDIDWKTVTDNLQDVMISKGGPVHSIEPQICQGARQAKADGVDLMIIGDASDYIFGGMDKLLSKDWSFDAFMKRYIYVDPFEVLKKPVSVQYLFERYRKDGDGIDFVEIIDKLATQESYGSYDNAFNTAGLDYFDPYEKLKMEAPLDLKRIRSGESKYLIRELFRSKYPNIAIPEKIPMPRPVDTYFVQWKGPTRPEFRNDIDIRQYDGNQKWLMWCLEEFLNLFEQ